MSNPYEESSQSRIIPLAKTAASTSNINMMSLSSETAVTSSASYYQFMLGESEAVSVDQQQSAASQETSDVHDGASSSALMSLIGAMSSTKSSTNAAAAATSTKDNKPPSVLDEAPKEVSGTTGLITNMDLLCRAQGMSLK